MKKIILAILTWLLLMSSAEAVTRYTVTKDQNGVMSNVTAWQALSGQSIIVVDPTSGISGYFQRLDVISLNGPTGSGVSQLAAGSSGYVVVYNSSVGAGPQKYISGSTIDPNTDVNAGLDTQTRTATAKTYYTNMSNSATLSGKTMYGGTVGNWGASSSVTATLPAATQGMNVFLILNQGQKSGSTLCVLFPDNNIIGLNSAFVAGSSTVVLSGVTLNSYMLIESMVDNWWFITSVTGISYRNR